MSKSVWKTTKRTFDKNRIPDYFQVSFCAPRLLAILDVGVVSSKRKNNTKSCFFYPLILAKSFCFIQSNDSLLIRLDSFFQFSSSISVRNRPLLLFVMPTSRFEQNHGRPLSDGVDERHRRFFLHYTQTPSRRTTVAFHEVKCVQQKKQNGWQCRNFAWRDAIAFCFIPDGPHGDNKARKQEDVKKHWTAGTFIHPVVIHNSII